MSHTGKAEKGTGGGGGAGFSLIELMTVLGILMTVSAIIATAMFRMTQTQATVWNRTEMHSAVRSATELMQQEIGQAGRIALPAAVTLTGPVPGSGASSTVAVSSSTGMFPGMKLVVGPDAVNGASQETVTVTSVGTDQITAVFQDPHAIGAAISFFGAFGSGVVPISGDKIISASGSPVSIVVTTLTAAQASSGTVLKLYGDINSDGTMVYVEYICNPGTLTAPGTLTRRVVKPFDTASAKSTFTPVVLLSNVVYNNPPTYTAGGTPCFSYQRKTVSNDTYVINVAVTLSIRTQDNDPVTKKPMPETKALLNVSPRNVYEAWQIPGNVQNRVQPMPQKILNLLP